jgi:hypothetical protein
MAIIRLFCCVVCISSHNYFGGYMRWQRTHRLSVNEVKALTLIVRCFIDTIRMPVGNFAFNQDYEELTITCVIMPRMDEVPKAQIQKLDVEALEALRKQVLSLCKIGRSGVKSVKFDM